MVKGGASRVSDGGGVFEMFDKEGREGVFG